MSRYPRFQLFWPVVVLVLSLLAGLVAFTGILPGLRAPLITLYLLVCPGMAYVALLRIPDPLVELVLGVAFSLALGTVIAMLLLYFGPWSPPLGLLVLIGLSLLGVALYSVGFAKPAAAETIPTQEPA